MRRRVFSWCLLLGLLALAACGGPAASKPATSAPTPTPTFTPTATPTATPAPTPPAGFVFYTSHDHTYQIAYPAGWSIVGTGAHIQFNGLGQLFEVTESASVSGQNPAEVVNAFCQTWQGGVAANPVPISTLSLAGQTWTRANCDAGGQAPALDWIVEVTQYQGNVYQLDYMSPIVEFARDNAVYYAPMEQSFHFLPR